MKNVILLVSIVFINTKNLYAQSYIGTEATFGISKIEFHDNTSKLMFTANKRLYGEIKTKNPSYFIKILFQGGAFQNNAIKDSLENSFTFKSNSALIGLSNFVKVTSKIYISGEITIGTTWFSKGNFILRNNKFDLIESNLNFCSIVATKFHFDIGHNFIVSIGIDFEYLTQFQKNSLIKNINGTGLVFGTKYLIQKKKKDNFNETIFKNF